DPEGEFHRARDRIERSMRAHEAIASEKGRPKGSDQQDDRRVLAPEKCLGALFDGIRDALHLVAPGRAPEHPSGKVRGEGQSKHREADDEQDQSGRTGHGGDSPSRLPGPSRRYSSGSELVSWVPINAGFIPWSAVRERPTPTSILRTPTGERHRRT